MNAGKNVPVANFSLVRMGGGGPKVIWSQAGTVEGTGQNLDVSLLKEGHSDPGFVALLNFRILFFFSDTIDDITFLITSNKHMADEFKTILCMVTG